MESTSLNSACSNIAYGVPNEIANMLFTIGLWVETTYYFPDLFGCEPTQIEFAHESVAFFILIAEYGQKKRIKTTFACTWHFK